MRKSTTTIILLTISVIIIVVALLFGVLNDASQYVYQLRNENLPFFSYSYDDYLIYIPLVIWLILCISGVKGYSRDKLNTFMEGAFSFALLWVIVGALKSLTGVIRPDGSDLLSFPSGHTASAFAASTLLYREYGYKYKWSWILVFLPAIVVGATRILNNRHWLSDVTAGAVIGIISVLIIYYFADQIYPHIKKRRKMDVSDES